MRSLKYYLLFRYKSKPAVKTNEWFFTSCFTQKGVKIPNVMDWNLSKVY